MANWVESHKPYVAMDSAELCTGSVLRRVPFASKLLGEVTFAKRKEGAELSNAPLADFDSMGYAVRGDDVQICPGIILTPDCDIFQQKCNALVVAQMLTVEAFIDANNYDAKKRAALKKKIDTARSTNPGSFNLPGSYLLLADDTIGLEDMLVLFENHMSLPIDFPHDGEPKNRVTEASIGGLENAWFRIDHAPLRIRLVNEAARHMIRIGIADA